MRFYIYNYSYNLVYTSLIKYDDFEAAYNAGNKFLEACKLVGHKDWVNVQVM